MPKTLFEDRLFGDGIRANRIKKHIKRNKEIRAERKAKKEAKEKAFKGRRATGSLVRIKAYKER